MFIFWGTRKTEKKEGYVAEFCPICRTITPFQLRRVGMSSHVYGVSLGSGKLLGHRAVCEVCTNPIVVDATLYKGFAKQLGQDLDALIRETFPAIHEVRAHRLAWEEQRKAGTLSAEEREMMLLEPFQLFADRVEANFGSGEIRVGKKGGWGCVGTMAISFVVLMLAVIIGAEINNPRVTDALFAAFGITFVVGCIYSLVQMALEPGRIFDRQILPALAKALKPLNPTKEELADILGRFKQAGFKIGQKTKPDALWEEMQRPEVG